MARKKQEPYEESEMQNEHRKYSRHWARVKKRPSNTVRLKEVSLEAVKPCEREEADQVTVVPEVSKTTVLRRGR